MLSRTNEPLGPAECISKARCAIPNQGFLLNVPFCSTACCLSAHAMRPCAPLSWLHNVQQSFHSHATTPLA